MLPTPRKSATEALAGFCVNLFGSADLDDAALLHQRDPVGQRECLCLVVGDIDGGQPEPQLQLPQFHAQSFA